MSRRVLTLYIAGGAVIVALVAAILLPVPYVILGPGPTLNTLGKDSSGRPLITISGHRVYPASGHLNMVTVSYQGGPGNEFDVFTALRAWLDHSEAVVPESELFAPGQSQQQVQQADQEQMTGSQQTATAAALHQLGIGYKTVAGVVGTEKQMPAAGVLRAGDLITAVDGQPVNGPAQLTSLIKARESSGPLRLTIVRGGATRQVQITPKLVGGRPELGVIVQQQYQFPFTVNISIGNIGGPSAGMMFALGIIDRLTGMDLAGGKFIAGTGEISPNGAVSAIGGIQQKMVGARDAGATVFLAPAGNCSDTVGAVPAGLRVVKVSTLSGAIADLKAIRQGKSVPSC
ncbi:MAG: PDZ domain-containing protein [Streptosporangiaceae bacterium]